MGLGKDNKLLTSLFLKRPKQILTHTLDITDIITHIVLNTLGVPRIVLVHAVLVLSGEILADILSFGVDAASNTAEELDNAAAQTETLQTFEEHGFRPVIFTLVLQIELLGRSQNSVDQQQHQDTEADQLEAHDGTTPQLNFKAVLHPAGPALVLHTNVAHNLSFHTNVPRNN